MFTNLFKEIKYVLQLFKALHPEAQNVTADMINIITIENILVNDIYNDLGFMVGDQLIILVEAQSTWSINIIIRALLYLVKTYLDYMAKMHLNVYGSKDIYLPEPEIYVIYTGEKKLEKDSFSLSEVLWGKQNGRLDLKIQVLTDGQEGDIIHQYVMFTKVFDEQVKKHGKTLKAVEETIRICKDKNYLRDYLSAHETEVKDIMATLFDEQQIMDAYSYEVYNDGIVKGKEQQAKKAVFNLHKNGMSDEKIAQMVEVSLENVKKWLSEAQPTPAT